MSGPNEMRKYLKLMRGYGNVNEEKNVEKKKDLSMRDMLAITRNLNEDVEKTYNTSVDQENEEKKMSDYFNDNNVIIDFEELKIYDSAVIFGGTIDEQVQFVYKVTPEESTSGVEVEYIQGFDPSDPENDEIIKKIESYYDVFYKYWRDQLFNE